MNIENRKKLKLLFRRLLQYFGVFFFDVLCCIKKATCYINKIFPELSYSIKQNAKRNINIQNVYVLSAPSLDLSLIIRANEDNLPKLVAELVCRPWL